MNDRVPRWLGSYGIDAPYLLVVTERGRYRKREPVFATMDKTAGKCYR
jgi:hypothetical protein